MFEFHDLDQLQMTISVPVWLSGISSKAKTRSEHSDKRDVI